MYFISLFYGFFHVDSLWGNKQIKNAVEAWEKTFSPAIFDPTCRSRDPSWSKGHDLYCVWSYFSNLFFHSKNGCTFSRSWKMLVMCISSSHNFFFLNWKVKFLHHVGKTNQKQLRSLNIYRTKNTPYFCIFYSFPPFLLSPPTAALCPLLSRISSGLFMVRRPEVFQQLSWGFFFAERFVNMTPHNSLEGPFTFRRVKIQKILGKKRVLISQCENSDELWIIVIREKSPKKSADDACKIDSDFSS